MNSKEIIFNLKNIDGVAKTISEKLIKTNILFLNGCLGAGKTTLVKHITKILGGEYNEVTSPTFNLLNIYITKHYKIYHYDLYRLNSEQELMNLGIEDVIGEGLVIIEWGDIFEKFLSYDYIKIELELCEIEDCRKLLVN